MPLIPETKLGSYEILSPLGAGGMGEVWRARDLRLGRDVAIKALPDLFARDPERLARFEREAKTLASLSHPNVAGIHGLEEANGHRYLILEFVEGDTLASRLRRGPLPVDEALEIAQQIAAGVEAAHEKGIVHRDLKPGNVMLTPSGGVKVLDFGLAKGGAAASSSEVDLADSPTLTTPPTGAGVILGTAAYMSPEQARGRAVDRRTDIWSFGCVLYECLTGRPLFEGETSSDLIARILEREPDWSRLPEATPARVRTLLRRCLAKDPRQRLRDLGDARLELTEVLEGPPERAAVPARRRSPRFEIALAAAAALASVLATRAYDRLFSPGDAPPVRAALAPPPGMVLELGSRLPGPPQLSPDGRTVLVVARAPGREPQIYVRPLRESEARPLAGTEGAVYPFWSPDGKSVAFFSGGKLRRVELAGGPAVTICEAPLGKGGDWGRDGTILFAPGNLDPIHRVPASGGESKPVTRLDTASGENSHRFPQFLPGSKHFLYYARAAVGSEGKAGGIMVGSLDGRPPRLLVRSDTQGRHAGGHLFFARERSLMAQRFDARSRKLSGDAMPVADPIHVLTGANYGIFSVAAGGTLLYMPPMAETGFELALLDRSGGMLDSLGQGHFFGRFAISPTGRAAVGSVVDARSGLTDLWIQDLGRRTRTRLTFDPFNDWSPVWSPDGARVAFTSIRNGVQGIYVRRALGSPAEETLVTGPMAGDPKAWSPDGRHLVYLLIGSTTREDLWLLPLEGDRKPRPLLAGPANENYASFSPDGRWLAYMSTETGQTEIFVVPFPLTGRKWQVSTAGGFAPFWRPDGRELLYQSPDMKFMSVEIVPTAQDLEIGSPTALFPLSDQAAVDLSPDGRRFLVNRPASGAPQPPLTLVLNWSEALAKR